MKSQLSLLDGKYQVILASLADNKKEIEALKSQIDALKGQIAQKLVKIDQLSAQLTQQGADIIKLSQEIKELKASCEELKDKIDELLEGRSPVPTNGLAAWYPFNGNASDESGNGNNGVINGATLTSDRNSKTNSAYRFDGINDFIQTQFNGILGDKKRTLSLWLKTDVVLATDGMAAVSYGPNGLGTRFDAFFNFNKIGATANIGGAAVTYKTPSQLNDNKWHHYIFMIDSDSPKLGSIKVYQNGILLSEILSVFDSLEILVNTIDGSQMLIGKTSNVGIPCYLKGELDDIAVWNRALTADEISKIYKGEKF
jgi:cell division protein FtsB